jgi:hypothetical protein
MLKSLIFKKSNTDEHGQMLPHKQLRQINDLRFDPIGVSNDYNICPTNNIGAPTANMNKYQTGI